MAASPVSGTLTDTWCTDWARTSKVAYCPGDSAHRAFTIPQCSPRWVKYLLPATCTAAALPIKLYSLEPTSYD